MNFRSMGVGVRLAGAFGLMTILLLVVVIMAISELKLARSVNEEIVGNLYEKIRLANKVRNNLNTGSLLLRDELLEQDKSRSDELRARRREISRDTVETLGRLDKLAVSEKERALLARLTQSRGRYREQISLIDKLHAEGHRAEALQMLSGEARLTRMALNEDVEALVMRQENHINAAGAQAVESARYAIVKMAMLAPVAVFVAVLTGWLITRSVARPLNNAIAVAERVSRGDLGVQIEVRSADETGRMLAALRGMVGGLRDVVSDVSAGTEAVASAAAQIAVSSRDLSMRTGEQAGSLEETSSAIEQLTASARQNASHAVQVGNLASAVSGKAREGADVVTRVVDAMATIQASMDEIGQITGVIEGIAFQSNILSLNAGVEAARAGEHGRGFAVVAGEVQALAQRSTTAAREIKKLIERSTAEVEVGSQLAADTGARIEEIHAGVGELDAIINAISTASQEQSAGIGQISQAVVQLDAVTQQNAALVEETAAAAGALDEQAAKLRSTTSVFRLDTSRV